MLQTFEKAEGMKAAEERNDMENFNESFYERRRKLNEQECLNWRGRERKLTKGRKSGELLALR